jgi:tetratricopeptide (TPR) repeat protein
MALTPPTSAPDPTAAQAVARSLRDPELMAAAAALAANRLDEAETGLRASLKRDPTNVAAIRMFAELAGRLGRLKDAEVLLRRALELAPGFGAARANLATVLHRQNRPAEAIAELDRLLAERPDDPQLFTQKAAAAGRIGEYAEARRLYEAVLARAPDRPLLWLSLGHVLKTLGEREGAIAAYRRAIALAPTLGEAWWSLANMKTAPFGPGDRAAMAALLERDDLREEDRFQLDFALGKAAEDAGDIAAAAAHYHAANALRRRALDYDADATSAAVDATLALFTPAFLAGRAGWGCPAPDPIFILGMPRAGSTLVEQMLAQHPEIEGTQELPDLPMVARAAAGAAYPAGLAALGPADWRRIGEEYLARTRIQRKTARPRFIDKLPNNWLHVGLILLALPNATIIDARRHPMATGFSNWKQHFARGQAFSYALSDMGRYWADYARLMDHFDTVAPGRIHRVIHERLVDDPEAQVRALLAHAGLGWEPACLRFHQSSRPVRTASAEQVRRPLSRAGLDAWRAFEPWLGELRAALGPWVDAYPGRPVAQAQQRTAMTAPAERAV